MPDLDLSGPWSHNSYGNVSEVTVPVCRARRSWCRESSCIVPSIVVGSVMVSCVGFHQLLYRRGNHEEHVGHRLLSLINQGQLLCLPRVRRGLALVEIIERLQASITQRRQVLRQGSIFLQQKRLVEQGM